MSLRPQPRSAHPGAAEELCAELGRAARTQLDDPATPAQHAAAWRRLAERLPDTAGGRPAPRARWIAAAVAALGAAAVGLWLARAPATLQFTVAGAHGEPGRTIAVAAAAPPARIEFSEGTRIDLSPAARARVLAVSARGARVALDEGTANLVVVPRPAAAWSVVAGPFEITVTGTAFTLSWSAPRARIELSMHEGSVQLAGPPFAQAIAVRAGQSVSADLRSGEVRLSQGEDAAAAAAAGQHVVAGTAPVVVPSEHAPAEAPRQRLFAEAPRARDTLPWPRLVEDGRYAEVLSAAQRRGTSRLLASASLDELSALAEAARLGGEPDLARRALESTRARFPRSGPARTASFLLGRLAEEQRDAPARALSWYEQYLREAPDGPFAPDALGRKMLLLSAQDRLAEAREAARAYLARHPDGTYAAAARKLLAGNEPRPSP